MGDESQSLLRKFVDGEHNVLSRHRGNDDKRRQRAEHPAAAWLCQAGESEEIVVGAAGKAATVCAAALENATPAAGMTGLDPGGVSGSREVNVSLALSAAIVEARGRYPRQAVDLDYQKPRERGCRRLAAVKTADEAIDRALEGKD